MKANERGDMAAFPYTYVTGNLTKGFDSNIVPGITIRELVALESFKALLSNSAIIDTWGTSALYSVASAAWKAADEFLEAGEENAQV